MKSSNPAAVEPTQLAYTLRTRAALDLAEQCAEELGANEVGGVHMLLGLLRERENIAARILADLAVTEAKVVVAVRRLP